MNRKPPYYELDQETKRIAERVVEVALDLAKMQYNLDSQRGIEQLVFELADRLGLEPQPREFEPKLRAEVVPLRPFRVVESDDKDE